MIASVNNQPVRVEDVVEGGRASREGESDEQGVVVSHQTRSGSDRLLEDRIKSGRLAPTKRLPIPSIGHDEPEVVECIVLLRKNEETLPALKDVKAKVKELNDPARGRMLPGTKVELLLRPHRPAQYHDRNRDRKLARWASVLVVAMLFMFVNNIRTAVIVAINIPLALLFAFTVLYVRGKSANLLSIGAVDFGIIVDSSVIMVENIYRNLAAGNYPELALRERILRFVKEIDAALLVFDLDHGLRLRSSVHHARTGGAAFQPDGSNICLCAGRRTDAGPDFDARLGHADVQELQAGP